MKEGTKKTLCVRLKRSIREQIDALAVDTGKSVTDIITEAAVKHLARAARAKYADTLRAVRRGAA